MPRLITVLVLTTAVLSPAPAVAANQGCRTDQCAIRVARKKCEQRRPVSCIKRAALHHRVSFAMLFRKAHCETAGTLNPLAVFGNAHNRAPVRIASGTPAGLFQFKPSTFRSTPYGRHSIWLAKWNSLAAGWMHRVGRGGEWACR